MAAAQPNLSVNRTREFVASTWRAPYRRAGYQFYVMRVGYSLAQIVTWMEQLDHAVYYLSDFSYKKDAKDEGVNRARHWIYNVENYLIRLQSVYDRALQLTNNVFHFGIEESNVGHSVIVSNLEVSRTEVASLLRAVKKEVERKAQERHAIVHRASYQEDRLRRLELFYMFDKETWATKTEGLILGHRSHDYVGHWQTGVEEFLPR